MSEVIGQRLTEQFELFDTTESVKNPNEELRVCKSCSKELPLSFYSYEANYPRFECKPCTNKHAKVRKILHHQQGLPPENHRCPICLGNKNEVTGGPKSSTQWVLDHCHETESFRGWLCHKCNRALGNFNDDVNILERAIDYLNRELV